jgi:DNA-binding winged helix-turn-helix (wHTH) protein
MRRDLSQTYRVTRRPWHIRARGTYGGPSHMKPSATFETIEQNPIAAMPVSRELLEKLFPSGAELPVSDRISDLGLDGFHIALVPFHTPTKKGTAHTDQRHGGRRLLILPLTWKQLMMRVQRGVGPQSQTAPVVRFGLVTVNLASMEVRCADRRVLLTAKEFKVLRFFIANPNRVISRDELLDKVWGYENYPCTRTVDNHILRLRQKLEPDSAHPVHFLTSHGTGYKFAP